MLYLMCLCWPAIETLKVRLCTVRYVAIVLQFGSRPPGQFSSKLVELSIIVACAKFAHPTTVSQYLLALPLADIITFKSFL